jgi:hypothetical protein
MDQNKDEHTLEEIIENHKELNRSMQELGDLIKSLNPANKENKEVSK